MQRVSVHRHVLPRGKMRVQIPARAYWAQRSNLTKKYGFPSDYRSDTLHCAASILLSMVAAVE